MSGRPVRFKSIDDLINNCDITGDCFVWRKTTPDDYAPKISPHAPMTKIVLTNSVARILFTVVRYVPTNGRLIKWCKTKDCVNPFHYSEPRDIVKRRLKRKGLSPTDLLIEQESRHNILPDEELLKTLKATDPEVIALLMKQASLSPFDAKNLPSTIRQDKIAPVAPQAKKPLLVIKRNLPPAVRAKLEPPPDVDYGQKVAELDIFEQIRLRKQRMLAKTMEEWDSVPK